MIPSFKADNRKAVVLGKIVAKSAVSEIQKQS